jgi:hypothetical protein
VFDIEHTEQGECCNTSASPMNKADSDQIHDLCSRIAEERDRKVFQKLVEELNRILSVQDQRLQNNQQGTNKDV